MKKLDDDLKIANITPFGLRLQPDLKKRVEEAAKRNNRSLNAEIASRLERTLDDDDVAEDGRSKAAARSLLRFGMGDDLERRVGLLEAQMAQLHTPSKSIVASGEEN